MKISSRLLNRVFKKASLKSETRALSLKEIDTNLKLAYQNYYKVKGSDDELRATAMEQLAEALAEAGNKKKETMIKVLRQQEKQCKTAKKNKILEEKNKQG